MRKETAEWLLGVELRDDVNPLWSVLTFFFGIVLPIAAIAVLFLWLFAGSIQERATSGHRHEFEKEAVQHGAAEWTFDADGRRVFRWKGE